MNKHFAPGGEFSVIETLFDESHFSSSGEGLGDDGFIFRPTTEETWVVSTDCSVEDVHFRLDWTDPQTALRKALLANLSDINAMGGTTTLVFFNLCALKSWGISQFENLGRTLKQMELEWGFRICGGDTVRKDKDSFFAFTVMGTLKGKPLLRSQARPGHKIYVSGQLGGSAAGLTLLSQGHRPKSDGDWGPYFQAHFRPAPPLKLGAVLAKTSGTVAAIDISDGLSSELAHLAKQSNCRLVVEWSKLPYDGALANLPGGEAWRDWVLHGGEEYQLLFTGAFTAADLREMTACATLREIGRVVEGKGVGIINEAGMETDLDARGWAH